MPLFESECRNSSCERFEKRVEWYAHTVSTPDPTCFCGRQTVRLVSRFSAIWTGDLSRFDVAGIDSKNDKDGGHIAYRIRSSRLGNDKKTGQPIPEPVLIDSVSKQREFTRSEGLMMPSDINPNLQGTSEGTLESSEQRGTKGQWV